MKNLIIIVCDGILKHFSYPGLLKVRDKTYMFYNGNNYGKDGFGYAVLAEE
jgi:hypothetical protein